MDDMTACIITRTLPGADVTAEAVRALGLAPVVIPAAQIYATGAEIVLEGVQALLMTSAAAARTIEVTDAIKALPLYAVGDATAEAALTAGFETVISAGGDGATLAVLAADRMSPRRGALLHLRGQEVTGDVTGMLRACGFEARHIEVYTTADHPDFPARLRETLASAHGFVLIHSPAGARRLGSAIADSDADLRRWQLIGLSAACLKPLETYDFSSKHMAEAPDEAALMAALREAMTQEGLE